MKTQLNVLVACESSGVVRDAFRALGHNAWSCDMLPCDADAKYHLQGDVLQVLNEPWRFLQLPTTAPYHTSTSLWDLMIAHPPCTYLCNSGVCWLFEEPTWFMGKPTTRLWRVATEGPAKGARSFRNANESRYKAMLAGAEFFAKLYSANIPHIAVENPIMHGYAARHIAETLKLKQPRIKATQFVQPWQFGHGECKATGLHLKNLPKLVPTDIVDGREQRLHRLPPGPNRWKERSKTFEGIAKAMATQWSAHIIAEKQKAANVS